MLKNVKTDKALDLVGTCLSAIAAPEPGPIDERMRMWSRQGTFVSILEPGAGAFGELVRLIETKGWIDDEREAKDVLSRNYIETKVEELIGELVATAAAGGQKAAELTEKQMRPVWREWIRGFEIPSQVVKHYTVVDRLVLDGPIEIGTVTLSPLDDGTRNALLSECGLSAVGSPDGDSPGEELREWVEQDFPVGPGYVLAHATVLGAEPIRARQLFQQRVREVLHVLSFFRPFVWPVSSRVVIGLSGDVPSGSNVFLSVTPEGRVGMAGQRAALPWTLSGERWEHASMIGLSFVSGMLSKPEDERTHLEASCINAITWISRGLQDDVADSRFLKLCIGMESLLLRKGDYPYGSTMADRVAFLLGKTGDAREKVSAQLKGIYAVRSDIAHEGRSAKLEEQLGPAQFFATQAVRVFLQRMSQAKWQSLEEFIKWCNDLKWA